MNISSPDFWFAVAASILAVGAYGFVMLTIGRWLERGRETSAWVDMLLTANPRCIHCSGTGWVSCYEEAALTHCPCSKRGDEPPTSGSAL